MFTGGISLRSVKARLAGHKMMMLIATVARMGLGLLNFIVLARFLGPTQFGVIATSIAYATIVSLATDYGLAISAMRKASIEIERAGSIVGDAIALKTFLIAVVVPISLATAALFVRSEHIATYGAVFLGTCAYTLGDLMMVATRVRRRFDVEARLVVLTSVAMLAIVGGVVAWTGDLLATAIAYAVARLLYLAVVYLSLQQWLGPLRGMGRSLDTMWATLRESAPYALDNVLTVLAGQVDVLVFATFLTAHDMGIYQSGSRLAQVTLPFAVVLSTVYIPALATASAGRTEVGVEFRRLADRVLIEFTGLALAGGAAFALAAPFTVSWIYGESYAPVRPLWAGFGIFVLWRFAASGFGIVFTALGRVRIRVAAQILNMTVLVAGAIGLLPAHGLAVTSQVLALGSLPALLLYGLMLGRTVGGSITSRTCVSVSLVSGLAIWFAHLV